MTRSEAIREATRRAAKSGQLRYAVKEGLAPDDAWEVCSESDLDDWYAGASCVIECDSEGAVPSC
ncbi:MAG: hypothetical protein QJR02_02005 [Sinobacteraceae bacterium]|jgi:hypothetical protein|nr:hypothetical protein [Nevskiaceae bacterium]